MTNRYVNGPTAPLSVFAATTLVGALALGGCTFSLPSDPNTTWADVWDPSDHRVTVTLGLDADATTPRGFAEAVKERTDVQLQIVPTDLGVSEGPQSGEREEPELFIGLFPEGAAPKDAKLLGDEDVCILADLSWYSANNEATPREKKALSDEDLMAILKVSDPNVAQAAAVNMPVWQANLTRQAQAASEGQASTEAEEGVEGEASDLPDSPSSDVESPDHESLDTEAVDAESLNAASPDAGPPQSGNEKDAPIDLEALPFPAPGKIGSSLEATRSQNNVGTSVRYQVVEGTCAAASTYLVVAPWASEPAKELGDFFTSEDGNNLLTTYFITFGEGSSAQSEGGPARAKEAKAFSPAEVKEAIQAWDEAFN